MQSFWINFEETKFVILDKKGTLQLFYLPHILRFEKSLELDIIMLGNRYTKIAFSYNEKLVIIGNDKRLAVAEIKSIEDFF